MDLDGHGGKISPGAFDFERFTAISGGDAEFERELAGEYLSQSRQLLAQIAEGIERGDIQSIQRASHTLKGSSRTVGADALGQVGAELERTASHASSPVVAALYARAHAYLDSAERALDEYFGSDAYRTAA